MIAAVMERCRAASQPASASAWADWLRKADSELSNLDLWMCLYLQLKQNDSDIKNLRAYLRLQKILFSKQQQTDDLDSNKAKPSQDKASERMLVSPANSQEATSAKINTYIHRRQSALSLRDLAPAECHIHHVRWPLRRFASEESLGGNEILMKQVLYDVLLEAVFPTGAICAPWDMALEANAATMEQLSSGGTYAGLTCTHEELYAGSTAEGLAMERGWGHVTVDIDHMVLFGRELGVRVPHHHRLDPTVVTTTSSGGTYSCLVYEPDGCRPTYTRLRVTERIMQINGMCASIITDSGGHRRPRLRVTNNEKIMQINEMFASSIVESGGQHWLHTSKLNEAMRQFFNKSMTTVHPTNELTTISGPACQGHGGAMEVVPTLVANGPHPGLDAYLQRPRRGWPSQQQLNEIRQQPMCFVLTGHKDSLQKHLEARISWSSSEVKLITALPIIVRHGYIAFKYSLKSYLNCHKDNDDGRSYVGSYHLKTIFLRYLEKTTPSSIDSAFRVMIDLAHELICYLEDGKLPHYFLSECDLLGNVEASERQAALQAARRILRDPITAVLNCPSCPKEIYGDLSPLDLAAAFKRESTRLSCRRSRGDLVLLLSRLDRWRQRRYMNLLREDALPEPMITHRLPLKGLVDMLQPPRHLESIR